MIRINPQTGCTGRSDRWGCWRASWRRGPSSPFSPPPPRPRFQGFNSQCFQRLSSPCLSRRRALWAWAALTDPHREPLGLVQAVGSREDVELAQDGAPAESLVLLVDQQSLRRGGRRGASPLTGLLPTLACSGPPRRRALGVFRLERGPGLCPSDHPSAHPHRLSCPALLDLGASPPWTPRSCQLPSAVGSRLARQALLVFILPALPRWQHYTLEKRPWCLQTNTQNAQSCRDPQHALWGWWRVWRVLPRARGMSDRRRPSV